MAKLRAVKIRVQPVFVLDHGDRLEEVVYGLDERGQPIKDHAVIEVSMAEWPTYATDRFVREVAAWQERLDAEQPKKPGPRRGRGNVIIPNPPGPRPKSRRPPKATA